MIRRLLVLIVLCSICLIGCRTTETLFTVRSTVDMVIPAGSNTLEILGLRQEGLFPYEFNLELFNVTDDQIERLIAQKAFFTSKFNQELEFIEVVEVRVVNPEDETDEQEVFHFDPVPFGSKTELQLFPSLPNIKRFVKDDKMLFKVELTFRGIPTQNVDVRLEMEFGAVEI